MQKIERRTQQRRMELIVPLIGLIAVVIMIVVVGHFVHEAFAQITSTMHDAQQNSALS
jgi:fructose-specific phosphotransferase system IIC component